MRGLFALALAGCFSPHPHDGFPCGSGPDRWCPDPLVCLGDNLCHDVDDPNAEPHNMVFVTGSGTLVSIDNFDTLAQLDKICQDAADVARMPANHYVAWVSTRDTDAYTRLGDAIGFVRTDGAPLANDVQDLLDGKLLVPIDFTESRVPAPYDIDVFTQTDANGKFSTLSGTTDCITDPSAVTARSGQADATIIDWTAHKTVDCIDPALLYCFGIDKRVALDPIEPQGKLVFLSAVTVATDGGKAAFDAECRAEAAAKGMPNAQSMVGLVSTTAAGPLDAANSPDGWHRPDGITAIDANGDLIAPIDVDLDGTYVKDFTWTGSEKFTGPTIPGANCNDWTGTGSSNIGNSTRSGPQGVHDTEQDCGTESRVYCAEL